MEKEQTKRIIQATVISVSQQQPNDIYMSVRMRMFSTRPNGNGDAVTEAFINEIVANKEKYVCIPLCADTGKLLNGDYNGLGHMLDSRTGRFLSDQIGSFYNFEKVSDEYGVSLIGEARIAKRNVEICNAINELFEAGKLNFSFELQVGEQTVQDGITYIDVSPKNSLIGMAVVSIPAYPEAKALALVAEIEENSKMNKVFDHAYSISEMSLETMRERLFKALYDKLGDRMYDMSVERVCPDCIILYDYRSADTYKAEYKIVDEEIYITDVYIVVFERKGDEKVMTLEQAMEQIASLTIEKTVAETKAAELETKLNDANTALAEANTAMEDLKSANAQDIEAKDNTIAELTDEVSNLKTEAESFESIKAELDTIKAEQAKAELEAKQSELTKFAEKHNLDCEAEDVKNAIASLNYQYLVDESMKQPEKPKNISASLADDDLNVGDSYGGILKRTGNK